MLWQLFERLGKGFGATFAIDGTGNDASGVAGTLSTGIEALYGNMVKRQIVARDAQGR